MVEDAKRDEFKWKTLYQQEPPSDTGSWVATEEIKFAPTPTYDTTEFAYYGLTDLALSVGKGDYTVHIMVAVSRTTGHCHAVDFYRQRVDPEASSRKLVELAEVYRPLEWLIDDDNASKVFMQLVATAARSSSVPVNWKPLPMRGQNKETRASALRGMFKRGMIYFDPSKPWTNIIVNELLQFPNALGAGVDDCVDALSLLGRRLAHLQLSSAEKPIVLRPTIQQMTLNDLWEDQPRRSNRI
jgi:predicted phage terminase large subunit-like protein